MVNWTLIQMELIRIPRFEVGAPGFPFQREIHMESMRTVWIAGEDLAGEIGQHKRKSRHVIDARSTCRRPIMGDFGFRYHRYVSRLDKRVRRGKGESHVGEARAQSAHLNDPLIIVSEQISLVTRTPSARSLDLTRRPRSTLCRAKSK